MNIHHEGESCSHLAPIACSERPCGAVLHLQRIKEDLERKELAECTFRPAINAKSQDLMRGRVGAMRDRGVTHHEQLFYDAGRRRLRQEEYESWQPPDHTFQPNAHRGATSPGAGSPASSMMDGSSSLGGGGARSSFIDAECEQHAWGLSGPQVNHAAVVQRLAGRQTDCACV